jgi:hypothetical protein
MLRHSGSNNGTPAFFSEIANGTRVSDTRKWAVWLGRLTLEKISRVTHGQLKRVRNPLKSLRAKAGLTGS